MDCELAFANVATMAAVKTNDTSEILDAKEDKNASIVVIEQIPAKSDQIIQHLSGSCVDEGCVQDLCNSKAFQEENILVKQSEANKYSMNIESTIEAKPSQSIENKLGNDKEKVHGDSEEEKNYCVICRKLTKCQFVLIDKKNKKYLCGSSCFGIFRVSPDSYYQQNSGESEPTDKYLNNALCCFTCGSRFTSDAFRAPTGTDTTKQFCSQACYTQCQQFTANNKIAETRNSKMANKCVMCGSLVKDGTRVVQYKKANHSFCSATCINTFKAKNETTENCLWCQERRTIFDMISDPESQNKFCSLNCLVMYNVKLRAAVSAPLCCANCSKTRTLNYHLKMSDLSLRCFCSYPCVKAFCNRFSRNPSKPPIDPAPKPPKQAPRSVPAYDADKVAQQLKGKPLLCRSPMHCNPVGCVPQMNDMETQTADAEDAEVVKVVLPSPAPAVVPLCSQVLPESLPDLISAVPCFVLTENKSVEGTPKKLKELKNNTPSDRPKDVGVLRLAEAAGNDPSDGGGREEGTKEEERQAETNSVTGIVEQEEDILQMALRVANEMSQDDDDDDDVLASTSAEDQLIARDTPGPSGSASFEEETLSVCLAKGQKRKSTIVESKIAVCKTPESLNGTKRHRTEGLGRGQEEEEEKASEQTTEQKQEPSEASVCIFALKHSYGINAYKYWVLKKNAEIEAAYKKVACTSNPSSAKKGPRLFKLDLLQASPEELNQAFSYFVKEVRKPNGEEYAPDSVLYLCLGIQGYMHTFGRVENIFTDSLYEKFSNALNEVLVNYEVRLDAQGVLVCRIEEEHLWECRQLGAHSPHALVNTLVYLNTKHFLLRSPQQHLKLSFAHIVRLYRRSADRSDKLGKSEFLRYCPSASSEMHKKRKDDGSALEQPENLENPMRCPIKLYEFYLSKCPEVTMGRNDPFYLVPEISCIPDSPVWFTPKSYDLEGLAKIFNRLQLVREIQEALLTGMTSCSS